MEILAIVILTSLLLIREYATYKERQKLLDRIMSKDYADFKDIETPEKNDYGTEKEDEEVVSIDYVTDDEKEKVYGENQEEKE